MLCNDRIIVLSHTRYTDTSIIVQALSEEHGRISLMVRGFGGKSRSKLGVFHPMALLDAVYSYREERQVQQLTEYKPSPSLPNCTADLRKSTLLMFLAEVVSKSIREETADQSQFAFIDTAVQILEQMQAGIQNFHIAFLLKLSRHLGFNLNQLEPGQQFFDLESGLGTVARPMHRNFITDEQFAQLYQFADCPFDQLQQIPLSRTDRDFLLTTTLLWYGFRIPTMKGVNSYSILHEVFN